MLPDPDDNVAKFPTHRRVRWPEPPMPDLALLGDSVGVVHLGKVKVYDCPQDLHAAVMVACADELEAAEEAYARHAVAAYRARVGHRLGSLAVLAAIVLVVAVGLS